LTLFMKDCLLIAHAPMNFFIQSKQENGLGGLNLVVDFVALHIFVNVLEKLLKNIRKRLLIKLVDIQTKDGLISFSVRLRELNLGKIYVIYALIPNLI